MVTQVNLLDLASRLMKQSFYRFGQIFCCFPNAIRLQQLTQSGAIPKSTLAFNTGSTT